MSRCVVPARILIFLGRAWVNAGISDNKDANDPLLMLFGSQRAPRNSPVKCAHVLVHYFVINRTHSYKIL